jgi:hypothetical protein
MLQQSASSPRPIAYAVSLLVFARLPRLSDWNCCSSSLAGILRMPPRRLIHSLSSFNTVQAGRLRYFHNPLYMYSLRQGIDDGFLAPYRVHRIVSGVDAAGWRPTSSEVDRYGRQIPDSLYGTPDFDRLIA